MKLRINRAWIGVITLTPLLFLGGSSLLFADTVFGNLSGSFCGCGLPAVVSAAEFTPSANFSFTDAKLGVDNPSSRTGFLNVYLETDSGDLPGTIIEQIGSSVATAANGGSYVTADTFSTPIILSGGVPYWLVESRATAGTSNSWDGAGTASVPAAYGIATTPGGPWVSYGDQNLQFEIDGIPVAATPEPSSLLLLGLGLLGLAGLARSRSQAAKRG